MLRFPNPGSTIANFVSVYTAAFERLNGQVVGLDDVIAAIVDANLATSSGHMGAEAIARSTRADRTRDPLYNQLKMYAELFRALGWLHPTEQSSLNYTFTLLGRQVVAAGPHYLPLLGETALGISHPSGVLSTRGGHNLRPFAFILRTMLVCEDALSRDEMIVGPLSASSDSDSGTVATMATLVMGLRESSSIIQRELAQVAAERRVQINTLKNYTRWPIAIMRDCGWTEKVRVPFRGGSGTFEVYRLTEEGKEVAQRVTESADIRVDAVDGLPFEEKAALSVRAHYAMLDRSGFDVSPVTTTLDEHGPAFYRSLDRLGIDHDRVLLYSPFQSLTVMDAQRIFPSTTTTTESSERQAATGVAVGRRSRDHLFVEPIFVRQTDNVDDADTPALKEELRSLRSNHASEGDAAAAFALSRASDTQVEFYPLVSQLFRVLGFKSDYSRAGVNYQRWDACMWIGATAVPIEIKSPTEEAFLSTKAVRQALENKVVLLSRGGLSTDRDVPTLIVGYQIPNERGDMSALIDDVYGAFTIRVGVIDLVTLATFAMRAVTDELTIDPTQLSRLRGFLRV